MKKIKSVLCVFLSAIMLLCCSLTASAASVTPKISFAGHLVIYAANDGGSSSWNTSGHAFLSFKNTGSFTVKLGPLDVNPGNEVTFGTWGNQDAHAGIWYNLESYFAHHESAFDGRVSLLTGVTYADLATINSVIEDNDEWGVFNNCSSFAVKVWNSISENKLSAGSPNTPSSLMKNIQSKTNYENNRAICDATPVGYVNSNGNFVSVTIKTSVRSNDCNDIIGTINDSTEPVKFITHINMNPNSCEAA